MLYDEILKELQIDYNNRVTQVEMATKYNTTQGSIQRLLSNPSNILGIKIETLQRMFPRATIYGNLQITNNQEVTNSNNNIITQNSDCSKKELIHELSTTVLNHPDFSDSEKIKFLQFLQSFNI
jgi:hypothetical protein